MAIKEFQNEGYKLILVEIIRDIYYSDISYSSRLVLIRKLTEIISRKILNIGENEPMELGDIVYSSPKNTPKVFEKMKLLDKRIESDFRNCVDELRQIGNKYTHTKFAKPATLEEVKNADELLSNLFSIMFTQYFLKYPLTLESNSLVLHSFSFLPPKIRLKILKRLLKLIENEYTFSYIMLLDKFLLAKIKVEGLQSGYDCLKNNEKKIRSLPYPDEDSIDAYYTKNNGVVTLPLSCFDNAYDLLNNKLKQLEKLDVEIGNLYTEFEEAVKYYEENNVLSDLYGQKELEEFRVILEFAFIGREGILKK